MDVKKIRKEFPVTEHRLFMDHARVAPLPRPVQAAITAFAADACEQGTANYPEWMKEVEAVRALGLDLIGRLPPMDDPDLIRGDGCIPCAAFGDTCHGIETEWWTDWDKEHYRSLDEG